MKKIFFFIFFLLISMCLFAQELRIKDFHIDTYNLKARINKRDANNKVCALLNVRLTIPGADIRSNYIIGEVEYSTNTYQVYLADGAKKLQINVPGFLPLDINFKDINNDGITELKSNTTYILTIETPNHSNTNNKLHNINFDILPNNAKFEIDGLELNTHSVPLSVGFHKIKLTATDYETFEDSILVYEGISKHPVKIELKKLSTSLQISSNPDNAKVYLDGALIGVTPIENKIVEYGVHNLLFKKRKFFQDSISIKCDEPYKVVHRKLDSGYGMTINTVPDNAIITFTNGDKFTTPFYYENRKGVYDISIEKTSYSKLKSKIYLNDDSEDTIFYLKKQYFKKKSGYINFGVFLGQMNSLGFNVGMILHNFTFDVGFKYGLDKSNKIYWNNTSNILPSCYIYKPICLTGKIGYGIIGFNRFRFTPLIGLSYEIINGKLQEEGKTTGADRTSVLTLPISVRFEYAIIKHISLIVEPEYSISIKENYYFKQMTEIDNKLSAWGNSFNFYLGININF